MTLKQFLKPDWRKIIQIKVIVPLLFLLAILIIYQILSYGIQSVSTDKDVYSFGEEVHIYWSDFGFKTHTTCGESDSYLPVEIYRETDSGWEQVKRVLGKGIACVDGRADFFMPGDVCLDVPSMNLEGNLTWKSIYEFTGKVDSCPSTVPGLVYNISSMDSYKFKDTPVGTYKIKFGMAEKIIEIR